MTDSLPVVKLSDDPDIEELLKFIDAVNRYADCAPQIVTVDMSSNLFHPEGDDAGEWLEADLVGPSLYGDRLFRRFQVSAAARILSKCLVDGCDHRTHVKVTRLQIVGEKALAQYGPTVDLLSDTVTINGRVHELQKYGYPKAWRDALRERVLLLMLLDYGFRNLGSHGRP